jgi:hypothetical protein
MSLKLVALFVISSLSCAAAAQEITYRKHIRPLWQEKCAHCHGANSPYLGEFEADKKKFEAAMKGPRMDTYADMVFFVAYPDTGALQRRLDDGKSAKDGKPGNMYAYLGGTDEERQKNLGLFREWLGGSDAWKLNRWKARDDVPAITKEDLDRLKLRY